MKFTANFNAKFQVFSGYNANVMLMVNFMQTSMNFHANSSEPLLMFHANFSVNFYADFGVNFCANFYVIFRANVHDCELFMDATYSPGEKPFHANVVPDFIIL